MNIRKITFSEICRIMKGKDEAALNCVREVFSFALALPELICPECAGVIGTFAAFPIAEAVSVGKSVAEVFKKTEDYYTTYENAQIAQVLIVFSAYFDTIKRIMPNTERQIRLSPIETATLSEKAMKDYLTLVNRKREDASGRRARELFDYDLSLPNPFEEKETYDQRLLEFYRLLNQRFADFFQHLHAYEALSTGELDKVSAYIRSLPEEALKAYHQQHAALAAEHPDYFIFHTMDWQRKTRDAIDVGFQTMSRQIRSWEETGREHRARETVEKYARRHDSFLRQPILRSQNEEYVDMDGVTYPRNQELFVPQSFRALRYEPGMALEPDAHWENREERQNIGEFISDTLRHPETGSKPMVILGLPGAGKTLLCHMLAAQTLGKEYHVIIVRLRDTDAAAPIHEQITGQIQRDFGSGCSWYDIAQGKLRKPVAVIFDGYDELLQASGKLYADFISSIDRFQQEQQEDNGIFVRCIITSRTTLIDKSRIPVGAPVLRLMDFDEARIEKWCGIWNDQNAGYFLSNGLEAFRVDPESKVFELAKQPLLLMLLARYDADGNALQNHEELTRVQLYDNLIRSFIRREQRKLPEFPRKPEPEQEELVERAFRRVSIAAVGMLIRNETHVTSVELSHDLAFFTGETAEQLDGDKLFGSFFFIHTSKATENRRKLYAYEFLHNTFGEFLAASYLAHLLHEGCADGWYVALAYAPLFTRPVVADMFGELIRETSPEAGLRKLDGLLTQALKGILSGEILSRLMEVSRRREQELKRDEPIRHLALYTANLLILRTMLGEYTVSLPDYGEEINIWERLLSVWKYGFTQEDLARLAGLVGVEKAGDQYTSAHIHLGDKFVKMKKIRQIYYTADSLQDTVMIALAGTLSGELRYSYGNRNIPLSVLGTGSRQWVEQAVPAILSSCEAHELDIKSQYLWNSLIRVLWSESSKESVKELLHQLHQACLEEENDGCLYSCYAVMLHLIQRYGVQTLSVEDSRSVAEMLAQIRHPFLLGEIGHMVQDVGMSLLDYLDLNDRATVDQVYMFIKTAAGMQRMNFGDRYRIIFDDTFFLRMIRVYHRILDGAEYGLMEEQLKTAVKALLNYMESAKKDEGAYDLHREILEFARRLLGIPAYDHFGNRLLLCFERDLLSLYGTAPEEPDPEFAAAVICYLDILIQNGRVPAVELLNPAMKGVSIGGLFACCPEAVTQLFGLMEVDPDWLEDGVALMTRFVEEQGDNIPLHLCRRLRRWAKRRKQGAPLLSALDAGMKSL